MKFTVTVQVTDYRTMTVNAATKEEAIEKAASRLERQGATPIVFRAEESPTP